MSVSDIIRRNSVPLEPLPASTAPRLSRLPDVRAVLFDVYGTLFVSASGDISMATEAGRGSAAEEALRAAGLTLHAASGTDLVAAFLAEVARQHNASDVDYPEVDIHQVWRNVLASLDESESNEGMFDPATIERLAVEYETRVNPVWPMPGLVECLRGVREARLAMGIVSNAQAFTRCLFPALTGATSAELGFVDDLCIWSYEHFHAKPGRYLYNVARTALMARGIAPHEVLYVGNDMRNDIAPAAATGFITALFAGDSRSLRLRQGDPLVAGVEPGAVVTDLRQILEILCLAPPFQ